MASSPTDPSATDPNATDSKDAPPRGGDPGRPTAEAQLLEFEAIRQLKARYFRFLDGKRWSEWGELFTEDAVLDTTDDAADAVVHGRDAIVARVSRTLEGVLTVHHGHMPEIRITGPDRARAIWSMEDYLEFPGDPPARIIHGRGHYHEEYVKGADGRWRIHSLKLRRLWLEHDGRRVLPGSG
jgi:hypothetical protein